MSSGWIVQGRVIMALILREVHTLYGSSRLGYLWAVIQTMFGIGIFWGIREIAGARAPHGMSVLMFLLAGFGLWATFSETLTKCMSAVSGNKALLTFPQVTPLDLMLSRTVVVWGTQLSSGCVITGIAAFLWLIPLCLRLDGAFRRIPSDAFARARLRDAVRFIGGLLADAGENRAHDTAHLVLCIGHFFFRFDVSKEHCGHPAAQPGHAAH